MSELGRDYLVLVFLASLGTIQFAGAYSNLRGILLVPSRLLAGLGGLILVMGTLFWFFTSANRNLPDTAGGIAGAQQFVCFVAGLGAALILTYLLSSLINRSRFSTTPTSTGGLGNLRTCTVFQFWHANFERIRRRWPSST